MRGTWRKGSFTGDPGRYFKKGSGYRHLSLHRGSFTPEGNLESGGARVPGTGNDERRKALGTGHLSLRGVHEGDLEGGFLYWGPRRLWKWGST